MSRELAKTISYLALHLTVGFTIAYLLTGSMKVAGGIALIEPAVNAVAYYFHERVWRKGSGRAGPARASPAPV